MINQRRGASIKELIMKASPRLNFEKLSYLFEEWKTTCYNYKPKEMKLVAKVNDMVSLLLILQYPKWFAQHDLTKIDAKYTFQREREVQMEQVSHKRTKP